MSRTFDFGFDFSPRSKRSSSGGVEILASFDFSDSGNIDTFSRASAAGYTGATGTAFAFESAVDVLRSAHHASGEVGIILENEPTACSLPAPGSIVVTPGAADDFTATFSAVTGSVATYEWRLDGAGAWADTDSGGTATTITGSGAGAGNHVLNVRAKSPSGAAGASGSSSTFTSIGIPILFISGVSTPIDTQTTSAIDTTGAKLIVLFISRYFETPSISDSAGNSGWVYVGQRSLPSGNGTFHAWYCLNPTTSASHTFSCSGNTIQPSMSVSCYKGVSAFYSSTNAVSGSPASPGSITPPTANSLSVTGICIIGNGRAATVASPFTNLTVGGSPNNFRTIANTGYSINSTNAAVNPVWTVTGSYDDNAAFQLLFVP